MQKKKSWKEKKAEEAQREADKKPKTKIEVDKEAAAFIASLQKSGEVGDIKKKINFISTGSWVLNRLIGDGTLQDKPGGIPRGFIVEIFGDEGCGKTTVGLHIVKQAQLAGGCAIYADFERSLRSQFKYIENLGIDLDPLKFLHLIPDSFEDGAKRIGQGLIKLHPSVIIIDSVTTMLPKAAFDKEADESIQIGLHAKLTGTFLNWMQKRLERADCALVLLNQLRSNIKTSQYEEGPKEVTSGGKAVRFYTTVRIQLKNTGTKQEVASRSNITGEDSKKAVNQVVKAVVVKNKLDMPWKSGPIYIAFGQGIDNVMSLLNLGINKNVVKKSGGWFEWHDPNSDKGFKLQGMMEVKKYLEDHADVLEAMMPYLMPSTDTQEMDETQRVLEAKGVENLSTEEKDELKDIRKLRGQSTDDLEYTPDQLKELEELNKGLES